MLQLGFGLNDASVKTWEAKYKYHLERPETYIQRIIQSRWQPLHDSPSFPAYPSGHSTFGATAAAILSKTFGEPFKMTDNSHKGRKEFLGEPRTFNSFKEMARLVFLLRRMRIIEQFPKSYNASNSAVLDARVNWVTMELLSTVFVPVAAAV